MFYFFYVDFDDRLAPAARTVLHGAHHQASEQQKARMPMQARLAFLGQPGDTPALP